MKVDFRATPSGPLYVETVFGTTYAARPVPPQCWASLAEGNPLWTATAGPRFSLGAALRELRDEDLGRPVDEAPDAIERRAMRRLFFACIDDATKEELMRWGGGTWNLYRLLFSSPEARELAQTDDGRRLAWVCAQADMLFGAPWKKARAHALVKRLLHRPRKEIVGALGLPATNATVRTIARIVPANMNRKALRMFCWMLANDAARARAAHLRQLSAVVLGALASPHLDRVGDSLLHELADDALFEEEGGSDCDYASEILGDSVTFANALGRPVPVFHSLKALLRFFEDVVVDHRRATTLSNDPLPEAPDVFTPEERSRVRPLRSLAEWGAEGRGMRHCLAASVGHCRRAMEGTLAAWAIEGPERLTFAAQRDERGVWTVFDLKGEQNRPPSAQARAWADGVVRRLNAQNVEREQRRAEGETPCTSSSSTTAAA